MLPVRLLHFWAMKKMYLLWVRHCRIQSSGACTADHLLPFEKQFAAGTRTSLREACAGLWEREAGWWQEAQLVPLGFLPGRKAALCLQKNRLLAIFSAGGSLLLKLHLSTLIKCFAVVDIPFKHNLVSRIVKTEPGFQGCLRTSSFSKATAGH